MTGKSVAVPSEPFGQTPDGQSARVYTLENSQLRVRITDYGGRMVSIEVPDRLGRRGDVLLGFDDAAAYATAKGAFGALLGRNANRIAGGSFTLDGRTYRLPTNDGTSTLHGGPVGFDKVFWKAGTAAESAPALVLTHVSPDGDQGFPGELSVAATYRLDGDSLWLEFAARTTKPTLVSLSAHPYFNLTGRANADDALDHVVTIASEAFLPTNDKQIPTGEIRSVAGTPFDFREPKPLAARIRQADSQLIYGRGYDHCFVLGAGQARTPRFAASALDPTSGRELEIHTTQPGLQLYTGNKLNGSVAGRGGVIYRQSAGFAFEPQGFPDAPHHPAFPSTILRPGEKYDAIIRYRFLVR